MQTTNKKTKIQLFSILNWSKQEQQLVNLQKFTNSTTSFFENTYKTDNSFFSNFNVNTTHKFNSRTLVKVNSTILIDDIKKTDNILNNFTQTNNTISQVFDNSLLQIRNKLEFSKKFNKSYFTSSFAHSFEKNTGESDIISTNNLFNQSFNALDQSNFRKYNELQFGSEYVMQFNKFSSSFKFNYNQSDYDFKTNSITTSAYNNLYTLNRKEFMPQIDINYSFSRVIAMSFTGTYNNALQNYNSDFNKINYFGYNASIKFKFNINSVLQLHNSFSNNLITKDRLFLNQYVSNYRTIYSNSGLRPTTIIPTRKVGLNFLNTNPKTNTFLIVNMNHSWSYSAENPSLITNNNFNITDYRLSPKQISTTLMIFYEKNFQKIPFKTSINIDFNLLDNAFFINNELSNFKSTYQSYSYAIQSKLKSSPIHFDIGANYSITNFNNDSETSYLQNIQVYANCNGSILSRLFWKISFSNNQNKTFKNDNSIRILSSSLRYTNKNSKWEYMLTAYNILNFNSQILITNQSGNGYESILSNSILPGYLNVGAKFKF